MKWRFFHVKISSTNKVQLWLHFTTISKNAIKIKTQWTVFLTRVGFRQMPTRLPTWKAKSLYHVRTFLPTWFILPLKNCKDIFKYICFTLYLQRTVNNRESTIVFIDRHCLWWVYFSVDVRSYQFRVDLII